MECFICSKELNEGYLCYEHAAKLMDMLTHKEGMISSPNWKHHCLICGDYENRIIIEYPDCGFFCNKDIIRELERYK